MESPHREFVVHAKIVNTLHKSPSACETGMSFMFRLRLHSDFTHYMQISQSLKKIPNPHIWF
jgi:hypothetical protein